MSLWTLPLVTLNLNDASIIPLLFLLVESTFKISNAFRNMVMNISGNFIVTHNSCCSNCWMRCFRSWITYFEFIRSFYCRWWATFTLLPLLPFSFWTISISYLIAEGSLLSSLTLLLLNLSTPVFSTSLKEEVSTSPVAPFFQLTSGGSILLFRSSQTYLTQESSFTVWRREALFTLLNPTLLLLFHLLFLLTNNGNIQFGRASRPSNTAITLTLLSLMVRSSYMTFDVGSW